MRNILVILLIALASLASEAVVQTRFYVIQANEKAPATRRLIEAIRTELEPRLERTLNGLENPAAWRALFPVKVELQPRVSVIDASFGTSGAVASIQIGDKIDPALTATWLKVLAHETGHALAAKLKMENALHDEFWGDFFAWAVWDYDPAMMKGLTREARAMLQKLRKSKDAPTRELAEIQLSLFEGDAVRTIEGRYDLRRMYRAPERYLFSVMLGRMLTALAKDVGSAAVAKAGLDLLARGGVGVDVHELAARLGPALGEERVRAALREGGLGEPLAPLRSLRTSLEISDKTDEAFVELPAPAGEKLFLGIYSGDRLALVTMALKGTPARVKFRRSMECDSRSFGKKLNPRAELRAEAVWVEADGTYRKELLPVALPRLQAAPASAGECLIALE